MFGVRDYPPLNLGIRQLQPGRVRMFAGTEIAVVHHSRTPERLRDPLTRRRVDAEVVPKLHPRTVTTNTDTNPSSPDREAVDALSRL